MSLNHLRDWFSPLLLVAFAMLSTAIFTPWSVQSEEEFLPVEEAFRLQILKSTEHYFIAEWHITPEYYLYRDKIKIMAQGRELYFPKPSAKTITDPYFGTVSIYRHHLAIAFENNTAEEVKVTWQGCADAGLCYPPVTQTFNLAEAPSANYNERPSQLDLVDRLNRSNLWLSTLIFLGLGVLLAFTPCVLPMVPILSSVITSSPNVLNSAKKSFALSLVYVLSMASTYSLAGVLIALFGKGFQLWLQHPLVITVSAGIFILLAFAMFGFYNLQLSPQVSTRISSWGQSRRGSWTGAAIMGIFSALIVSPCVTPPLIGALLFVARGGDAITGGIVLFSLALGMGLPLLLIGTSLGRFLPQSGVLPQVIKNLGGFILLAVAVWLLDRITDPATTTLLGGLLIAAFGLYLLRIIRLLVFRVLIILTIVYGALLSLQGVTGGSMWNKPWMLYSESKKVEEHSSMFNKVYDLQSVLRKIEENKSLKKPTMLVLYADWCVSCKELEAVTFSDSQVQRLFTEFNSFEADITRPNQESRQILTHFELFGPPAIMFFDLSGNEIKSARVVGFIDADAFVSHLQKTLSLSTR